MRMFDITDDEILRTCVLDAKSQYKDMSDEWYQQWAKEHLQEYKMSIMETNIFYHLRHIKYPEYLNRSSAHRLAYELPMELYQNLNEWIDEKPISEIKYGDLSIKEIVDTYAKMNRGATFVDCCDDMLYYIQTGCVDKGVCFHLYEEM